MFLQRAKSVFSAEHVTRADWLAVLKMSAKTCSRFCPQKAVTPTMRPSTWSVQRWRGGGLVAMFDKKQSEEKQRAKPKVTLNKSNDTRNKITDMS